MRRRGAWISAAAALVVCTTALTPAGAAPPDPAPRPPLSHVLAVDPSAVDPPDDVGTALAVGCPRAGYGVRSAAPGGGGKTVALTFDDGPGPETAGIIRVLEDAGVAGTFFNIGVNMTVRPSLVRTEQSQDFLLGNHTWSHPEMPMLSASGQAAEMDRATSEQRSLGGTSPCAFRPPYGEYDGATLSLAEARRMEVWNWSVDTLDWQARGSSDPYWVDRIVGLAEAGGDQTHPVLLMHNQPGGSAATLAALPQIISFYRDGGYAFVDLFGHPADQPVTGDWDGNGTETPGVVRGRTWYLRNSNSAGPADIVLRFGTTDDRPVVGDWNDDGVDTPGVVHGRTWYLRDDNAPKDDGRTTLTFGTGSDTAVAGDWNGDGTDTPGVVSGSTWHLRSTNAPTSDQAVLDFGAAGYRPIVGDWNGDGVSTPGMVSETSWHLRDTNAPSSGAVVITYGASTDRLVTGDWDGDGDTTPGVVRGDRWFLRNADSSGGAQKSFTFGP
jgi:peptidoglycan/xylan/chitin deacetylase (PgdA/CDA1 family)